MEGCFDDNDDACLPSYLSDAACRLVEAFGVSRDGTLSFAPLQIRRNTALNAVFSNFDCEARSQRLSSWRNSLTHHLADEPDPQVLHLNGKHDAWDIVPLKLLDDLVCCWLTIRLALHSQKLQPAALGLFPGTLVIRRVECGLDSLNVHDEVPIIDPLQEFSDPTYSRHSGIRRWRYKMCAVAQSQEPSPMDATRSRFPKVWLHELSRAEARKVGKTLQLTIDLCNSQTTNRPRVLSLLDDLFLPATTWKSKALSCDTSGSEVDDDFSPQSLQRFGGSLAGFVKVYSSQQATAHDSLTNQFVNRGTAGIGQTASLTVESALGQQNTAANAKRFVRDAQRPVLDKNIGDRTVLSQHKAAGKRRSRPAQDEIFLF